MNWNRRRFSTFLLVLGVGLAVRLILAWGLYGNYDMSSYDLVTEILHQGGNVYAETTRYNYSPLWMGVLAITSASANWLSLPHHAVLRAFLTCVDLANAILIALIAGNRQFRLKSFALYWLNPGVILIIGYHGQFECLALFFLLLALWTRNTATSVFLGGVAVLVKHIILFNAWVLFVYHLNFRRAIIASLILGLIFVLSFVPFLPEGAEGVLRNVFLYRASDFGPFQVFGSAVGLSLFLGLMILAPFVWRRMALNLATSLALTALLQVTLMPGLGAQYFMLSIALTSLIPAWWKWTLTLGLFLGLHYLLEMLLAAELISNQLWYLVQMSLFLPWIFNGIFLVVVLWSAVRRRQNYLLLANQGLR